ncbi:MAG: cupin domain-containing protein [Bacteroidetes bacterium]|nr:cupin domain-containing protein [Bacteroidota bacterium]
MRLKHVFIVFLFVQVSFAQKESCANQKLPKRKATQNEMVTCFHDSLQSSFRLTIPHRVVAHYHQFHTENIFVLQGRAEMRMNDRIICIKKGMHVSIPKGTIHSVEKVLSKRPLVVISVQSPYFDGKDRVIVSDN